MIPFAERSLVLRLKKGDQQAFATLLDQYETKLYRLALRFTYNATEAEDLTQNIFLGIHRSLPNFRGEARFNTWVYRIAMNHCLEYRRRKRPELFALDEHEDIVDQRPEIEPEASALRGEVSSEINCALSRLSSAHKDVIVLHELHGLTYQEVATLLEIPVGTVKSRLFNALKKMRELMSGFENISD